jgi:hypothetical protein
MEKIVTIPYDEVNFVWVSGHYDIHMFGLCKMGNTLFYFKTINIDDYYDDETELMCEIYMLSFKEEIRWRLKKFLFERMVGYHWTYPYRKQGAAFYVRNPKWLYKILFKLYYSVVKKIIR